MRALLIVNPHATSTTRLRRDVIARALASAVQLEIVETRYRGHGIVVAAEAAAGGFELVIALGGDGTVNEAVNGLMREPAQTRPALAALPGGSANVFVRALGLPADPIDATGQVLAALTEGRDRRIGLGLAGDRYFTFNSGLGLDAEVVRAVEGRRADGRAVTPALYLRTAIRQFYQVTDRRHAALTVNAVDRATGGRDPARGVFWCAVSNTAPWTYLGRRPVRTSPEASFDTGLDLFGLRRLGTITVTRTLRQMMAAAGPPASGRAVLSWHDVTEATLSATRPVAFQVDGDYVGEREQVRFQSAPAALRVVM